MAKLTKEQLQQYRDNMPEHMTLQDAEEALKWHQDQLAELRAKWKGDREAACDACGKSPRLCKCSDGPNYDVAR